MRPSSDSNADLLAKFSKSTSVISLGLSYSLTDSPVLTEPRYEQHRTGSKFSMNYLEFICAWYLKKYLTKVRSKSARVSVSAALAKRKTKNPVRNFSKFSEIKESLKLPSPLASVKLDLLQGTFDVFPAQ
ncbi:hypothetical protein M8J77_019382 [Diaphorina citri]|nr:hypothetical protein M8J77_019382 [Diaphorina citri]